MISGTAWGSNATFPLPYYVSGTGGIEIVYIKDSNSIRITTYQDRSNLSGIAILYYTKTTD